MLLDAFGWLLVGCGIFALTEGYYAVRQRSVAQGRNLWWLAGLVVVAGLALVRLGLALA